MTLPKNPLQNSDEKSDKKMVQGSFAVSLILHGILLLIIGSLVIVPGAIKKYMPVTAAQVAPVQIPEPPKIDDAVPAEQSVDAGGSPIGDVPEPSSTSTSTDTTMDALTIASPASTGPSMNATPGTSSIPGAFNGGKGGFGGGTGTGIGTGSGPGVGKMSRTLFGSTAKSKESLEGHFYDLKQSKDKVELPGGPEARAKAIEEFITSGFSPAKLQTFFQASSALYTTHIFFPNMNTTEAPKAFNVEKDVKPSGWIAHYQAVVAPPTSGMWRFVGWGDDFLVVGVNRKVVLDGSIWGLNVEGKVDTLPGMFGVAGNWIDWKADEFRKVDIVIGDHIPINFGGWLYVQKKDEPPRAGETTPPLYLFRITNTKVALPKNVLGTHPPILDDGPVFKTK